MPRASHCTVKPKHQRVGRQRLSILEQLDIVKRVATDEKQADIARSYGVTRQAVTHLKKRAAAIRAEYNTQTSNGFSGKTYTRRTLTVAYPSKTIDLELLGWLRRVAQQAGCLNVTGEVLRHKAKAIAAAQGHTKFQATGGWLARFKKRYNVASFVRCGEAAKVVWTPELIKVLANLRHALEDSNPSLGCIWNLDEAALYYRSLSARSFAARHGNKKTLTVAKDRVTITCAVSACGEKMPLQVINKSLKPQKMRPGCKLFQYKCHFDASKKAWQTSDTLIRYLEKLNDLAEWRDQTFYVLLDNASSHVKAINILGCIGML